MTTKQTVLFSPLLVIGANLGAAVFFGEYIGKWAFVPMMLTCWGLWVFFVLRYSPPGTIGRWLRRPSGSRWWLALALLVGLLPLPLFLLHASALSPWTIWLPWLLIALVNPWIEEFYWRGLLLDHSRHWPTWLAIAYSSVLFSANHFAFGINSVVNSGYDVLASTLVMGMVWGLVYQKTKSLRWAILSHFLVDVFNLSAAAFLDASDKGSW